MLTISWPRFYHSFKADLKLWCYFVLFQQACRCYFMFALSNYLAAETKISMLCQAMLHGLRFDALWATIWIFMALVLFTLPSLLLNFQAYRRCLGGIFTVVTATLYIVSIEYFREYKDIFNQFLFGLFYDDKAAILKTVMAEHHVIQYGVLLCVVLLLYVKYLSPLLVNQTLTKAKYSGFKKLSITCLIVFFYVISFRGSLGPRPIQLKDAGITTDTFLNKAIVSPYSALRYAIKEHLAIQAENGYRYATAQTQDLTKLAKQFFNTNLEHAKLSDYMQKTATGSTLPKPQHIFLIIGESLDAWPLQKEYREFNLTPQLHKLITAGLYLKYFLPCASGTMATLNTIITGLPDVELRTNYQPNSYQPYPTAIATQFKKLGFKSQFFYGDYLSWQRLEDFAYAQGFDAVYGAAHISDWQQTNEWGVDDQTLFDFITKTIATATTPTFNVIMTTSNHPPFSINLTREGFDEKTTAQLLAKYPHTEAKVKELGHIWYADKAIDRFVTKVTKHDSSALFAITGDHFGRKHILPNPPLFDLSAVPFILYGNNIQKHYNFHAKTAGSHLDLSATLIELIAAKGFVYHAMGENLFAQKTHGLGIGQQKIITTDFIAATTSADLMHLSKHKKPISEAQLTALKERHNQAMSIAWWLIKKGDNIK